MSLPNPSTRCATEIDSFRGYWRHRGFINVIIIIISSSSSSISISVSIIVVVGVVIVVIINLASVSGITLSAFLNWPHIGQTIGFVPTTSRSGTCPYHLGHGHISQLPKCLKTTTC